MTLFDPGPPVVERADSGVSYGRRLTMRRESQLAAGVHPVTRRPLDGDPEHRCGNCAHFFVHRLAKTHFKCDLSATRGVATDVRKSWPACDHWTEEGS